MPGLCAQWARKKTQTDLSTVLYPLLASTRALEHFHFYSFYKTFKILLSIFSILIKLRWCPLFKLSGIKQVNFVKNLTSQVKIRYLLSLDRICSKPFKIYVNTIFSRSKNRKWLYFKNFNKILRQPDTIGVPRDIKFFDSKIQLIIYFIIKPSITILNAYNFFV